jgi:hypothetical protein
MTRTCHTYRPLKKKKTEKNSPPSKEEGEHERLNFLKQQLNEVF